jgi:hypothetical protein
MSEETRKILDMLAKGKITVDEAEKLLSAVSSPEAEQKDKTTETGQTGRKYLRVIVEPGAESTEQDKINIRVPLKLIRAGLKWAAFIPKQARTKVNKAMNEKGIDMDFTDMKPEDLEDLVTNLDDLTVDIEGKEKISVRCE